MPGVCDWALAASPRELSALQVNIYDPPWDPLSIVGMMRRKWWGDGGDESTARQPAASPLPVAVCFLPAATLHPSVLLLPGGGCRGTAYLGPYPEDGGGARPPAAPHTCVYIYIYICMYMHDPI